MLLGTLGDSLMAEISYAESQVPRKENHVCACVGNLEREEKQG